MTEKQIPKLVAMLVEHQGCFAGLPTEDAQWVIQNTPDAITLMMNAVLARNGSLQLSQGSSSFLRLISGDETLVIDAVDGSEILADAKDVFTGGIDSDFRSWGADESGHATDATPVDVYEMTKNGTHAQLFGSLNADVEKLFFTQAQIQGFVKKYPNWLRTDGYATFFGFKSNGKRFVAYVYFVGDGALNVRVRKFEHDYVWHAEHRHRFVLPQLAEAV